MAAYIYSPLPLPSSLSLRALVFDTGYLEHHQYLGNLSFPFKKERINLCNILVLATKKSTYLIVLSNITTTIVVVLV